MEGPDPRFSGPLAAVVGIWLTIFFPCRSRPRKTTAQTRTLAILGNRHPGRESAPDSAKLRYWPRRRLCLSFPPLWGVYPPRGRGRLPPRAFPTALLSRQIDTRAA